MSWFNYYGLAIMALIMIPNIIFAVKHKGGLTTAYKNKPAEIFEQTGRYGCFAFMIFNVPYACLGFWFDCAFAVYLSVNGCLCLAYIIFWIFCRKNGLLKALSLSVIPSLIFLFSGVVLANFPLLVFAVIFAVCHILISVKNADGNSNTPELTSDKKDAGLN